MKYLTHKLAAALLSVSLSACGGGGGAGGSSGASSGVASSAAKSSGAASSGAASSAAVSTPSVVWTPAASTPGQITAVSADTAIPAGQVLTFGQVFKAGEMTTTGGVLVKQGSVSLPTQVDVKRLHADGSIRHAILSVQLAASAGSQSLQVQSGSNISGSALTLAAVQAGSVNYQVNITETGSTTEAGKTWSVTLKNALAAGTSSWLSGPLTSEWRSRIAPANAGSNHPSLRVLFDARYHSTSQGRVSIAIENVESTAARGDRTYSIEVRDAAGTVVFSQSSMQHYAQTRFRKIFYFGGHKEMMAIVDLERLKNARAIPNYANVTMPEATIAQKYANWSTSERGLFEHSLITRYMPATGGRDDIGPLPGWVAGALVSRDPRLYQVMFDQTERASFFNIHYRDAVTNDIISLDLHPTVTLLNAAKDFSDAADKLPAASLPSTVPTKVVAGVTETWEADRSHQPAFAYIPYLITGDHYYLDELYFWANYNMLAMNFAYRGNEKGWMMSEQVRGQAWSIRTMGYAAWIAPDADWQKNYFTNKLENNLTWYRTNLMTNTASVYYNSLGYWSVGLVGGASAVEYRSAAIDVSTDHALAPWQHNFMAYTLYELCERGYAATDLRNFALGFTTKLYTSDPAYNKFDGPAYYLAVRTGSSNSAGLLSSMADIYNNSFVARPAALFPTSLPAFDDPNGYAAIALAALAASTDSSVTKASEAYVFARTEVMAHPNIYRSKFVDNVIWNIVPYGSVVGLTEAPGIYPK